MPRPPFRAPLRTDPLTIAAACLLALKIAATALPCDVDQEALTPTECVAIAIVMSGAPIAF
jgi:hypothetical protein